MLDAQRDRVVTMDKLPLEDEFTDVLNKAQRGLQLSDQDLVDRTALSLEQILAVKGGCYDTDAVEKMAFCLKLHAPAVHALALQQWEPNPVKPFEGLAQFTTWYGDMTVNAYLIWDPATREAASFDTGSTCQPILDCLKAKQLELTRLFITHTHMDHLADLNRLHEETGGACYGSAVENPLGLKPSRHGDGFIVGNLKIRVLGTFGHTPGGLSYFVEGLEKPIVIVGDALFAGSQGGAPYAYEDALKNNRERILTLPLETIICPGHGPLTTVAEERAHNPFFPELK